jgi:hypothetical protein
MSSPKQRKSNRQKKNAPRKSEKSKLVDEISELVRREVEKRSPNATFEERQDIAFDIMTDVLWKRTDEDLSDSVTDDEELTIGGKQYRRMSQPSAATYFGRWGKHRVEEPLYREVGVRNGPTIKPVELRAGIIEHMTPDLARVVGALSADEGSRALVRTLRTVGISAPSRAFLATRLSKMSAEIADAAAELEAATRRPEALPQAVASVSCGLDRMSVRMSENADDVSEAPPRSRTKPYVRKPPPPKEFHYRKAWVGSTSVYDVAGNELHTWRISAEADADPAMLADRVAADVAWVVESNPTASVLCIQDAAPELSATMKALERALPADTQAVELVDFEHLMGYLEDVVDACDPDDIRDMKGWFRGELLNDDGAIDRILRNLRWKASQLRDGAPAARDALAKAIRYIRRRKNKMRYASLHQDNRPIGSGATESTCWQMQQRVKRPGQSWEPEGLRGTLAVRALVLSDRWDSAWPHYAAKHRETFSFSA